MHILLVFLFALALNAENTEEAEILHSIIRDAKVLNIKRNNPLLPENPAMVAQVLEKCSLEDLQKIQAFFICSLPLWKLAPQNAGSEYYEATIVPNCEEPTLPKECKEDINSIFAEDHAEF